MKRILFAILCFFSLGNACASAPEPVYPDEEAIRENAAKSHENLRKEQKKHHQTGP